METIKRIIGAFLVLAAIAVVAQAVIPGGRNDLWTYVNPLMAISVLLVIAHCVRSGAWRAGGGEDGSAARGLSESRLAFFAALFFAYLFFLNWFRELDDGGAYGWVWIALNGAIPVLNVWTAIRLWTGERE